MVEIHHQDSVYKQGKINNPFVQAFKVGGKGKEMLTGLARWHAG